MALLRRALDEPLLTLLEESGRNVQRTALLLRDLLADYPEHAALAQDLRVCEREGDRITHDLIHRLNGTGRVRAPFDAGDGYRLATALDDIVDEAEQAADTLGLYATCSSGPVSRWRMRCAACGRATVSHRISSRSTDSRTKAIGSAATPWRRCSSAVPTRWS